MDDAETIYDMQIKSFTNSLKRYQDFETSPGDESIDKTVERINQSYTDYYIIKSDDTSVGGVRIVKKDNKIYRVSPIFILPEFQGQGIAQKVFGIVQHKYNDAIRWELDTILEENGNCYLYEKLSYIKTGKTEIINSKMTIVFYEKNS